MELLGLAADLAGGEVEIRLIDVADCDDLGAPGDVDVPEDLPGRVGDAGAE